MSTVPKEPQMRMSRFKKDLDNELEQETDAYIVNPSLRSLYPYIYQVGRGEQVDIKTSSLNTVETHYKI